MSAATDPAEEAARLAPPPPGTVVWSLLPWHELLVDCAWLESRWSPLAQARPAAPGAVLLGDRLESPDARAAADTTTAGAPRLQSGAAVEGQPPAVPLATLHPFVIR